MLFSFLRVNYRVAAPLPTRSTKKPGSRNTGLKILNLLTAD